MIFQPCRLQYVFLQLFICAKIFALSLFLGQFLAIVVALQWLTTSRKQYSSTWALLNYAAPVILIGENPDLLVNLDSLQEVRRKSPELQDFHKCCYFCEYKYFHWVDSLSDFICLYKLYQPVFLFCVVISLCFCF